ncbi:hypothetical protein NQ318_015204 [Aromia moschata]|uniref:PIH1D1/2/3 CS-like domain-containing protein n=1 Tax=Aromia moschata TaxID=1265417 RepID=A0AAV8XJP7_9CUCU|nr:hypothetical protein NQ318_015204 [Aromia moschata]
MTELTANDLKGLCELLNAKPENSDSEDETGTNSGSVNTLNPSHLEPSTKSGSKKVNPYGKIKEEKKRRVVLDPDDENAFDFDIEGTTHNPVQSDWKKTPSWNVSYRQQVTASDVFLQMGFKNPTTASCEDMIITIHLPEEKYKNMDLKIEKDKLNLVTPRFYLDLPLPQPVDPQKGNAQWNKDEEKLIVTLKMDREFDIVNF